MGKRNVNGHATAELLFVVEAELRRASVAYRDAVNAYQATSDTVRKAEAQLRAAARRFAEVEAELSGGTDA